MPHSIEVTTKPTIDQMKISLRPKRSDIQPDSDLGERLVTRTVGALTAGEAAAALDRGLEEARAMQGLGLIAGAALFLNGCARVLTPLPMTEALAHA